MGLVEMAGADEPAQHSPTHLLLHRGEGLRCWRTGLTELDLLALPSGEHPVDHAAVEIMDISRRGEFCRQMAARGDSVLAACRHASPELMALPVRIVEKVDVEFCRYLDCGILTRGPAVPVLAEGRWVSYPSWRWAVRV